MEFPSLAPLTVGNVEPLELIPAAAAAGFPAVGLRLTWSGQAAPIVGDATAVRDIRHCLVDHGVGVMEVLSLRLEPESRVDEFAPLLETAAELGGRFVLVTTRDPDWSRGAANLARLGELAEGYGIRPGLEFWRGAEVRRLDQACAFIADAGHPNVGLVVDALHLHRSGGTPAEVAAVAPGLHAFVQLCDATWDPPAEADLMTEALTDRRYPGQGQLWLGDLIGALPPDVPVSLEAPCARNAHLSATDQARLAADATRAFLDRRHAQSASSPASRC